MDGIKYSYIDRLGYVAIDAGEYHKAGGFSDELAPVSTATDGWGYIDTSGRLLIEPQFYSAMGFSEELAAVCTGDKWGFIDKTGHIVIEPRYDAVSLFSEGIAVAVLLHHRRPRTNPYSPREPDQIVHQGAELRRAIFGGE
jgi:hypothetical protein